MTQQFNYNKLVKTVERMIKRFGRNVSIVVNSNTANVEPWKPGTVVPQQMTTMAVFVKYEQKYIDGTVIQIGDEKMYFSPVDLTVDPNLFGQVIDADGSKWNILNIKPLNPGNTKLMYTAQVRQ